MENRLSSITDFPLRKSDGTIDSLQVKDTEETIKTLRDIGVSAKKSNEYDDEIDIENIDNKTKFIEWLKNERFNLSTYPRLRSFLK